MTQLLATSEYPTDPIIGYKPSAYGLITDYLGWLGKTGDGNYHF